MCQYCSAVYHDGWGDLLEYDDVYQRAVTTEQRTESTYGFHDSWEDLSKELTD